MIDRNVENAFVGGDAGDLMGGEVFDPALAMVAVDLIAGKSSQNSGVEVLGTRPRARAMPRSRGIL